MNSASERIEPSLASQNDEGAAKLATEILVAYLPTVSVHPTDLPRLVRDLRAALQVPIVVEGGAASGAAPEKSRSRLGLAADRISAANSSMDSGTTPPVALVEEAPPAALVEDSINDDYLISLEDGKRYRSLKRHLMAKYGMTPDDYRRKWGLPQDYPMVAPSYARDRSEVAKRIGLGRAPSSGRKGGEPLRRSAPGS